MVRIRLSSEMALNHTDGEIKGPNRKNQSGPRTEPGGTPLRQIGILAVQHSSSILAALKAALSVWRIESCRDQATNQAGIRQPTAVSHQAQERSLETGLQGRTEVRLSCTNAPQ